MTLPQNVAVALKSQDQSAEDSPYDESAWQTIRAHLLSQDAEIERLRGRAVPLTEWQCMESRLAAANALLREIMEFGEDRKLHTRIQTHLQGAGDEA